MKITAQEEYGLRCLLRLARAEDGHSLTIPEVAADEGLSVPYVGKLLSVLRQKGLIESVRGRSGGYRLAGTPADVTLGAVLRALGEPLFDDPGYCQRHASPDHADRVCIHNDGCTLRALWQTLEGWMRRALDQVTLADLQQTEIQVTELLRSRLEETVLQQPTAGLIALTTLQKEPPLAGTAAGRS
jgi:Rrf2 family protein